MYYYSAIKYVCGKYLSVALCMQVSRPRELVTFVQLLHRELHAALPHALLLWYDSVTVAGHLNWQNCLNEKNRFVSFYAARISC